MISFGRDLNRIDVFFQPLWAYPGKLTQKFSRDFSLRGVTQTNFWKTYPVFFEISFFGAWARAISEKLIHQFFLITLPVFVILDEFSRNRSVSPPEFLEYHFPIKYFIFNEFSRKLMPRKFANKGSDQPEILTDICSDIPCKSMGFCILDRFSKVAHPLLCRIYTVHSRIGSLRLHHDVAYIHTCSRRMVLGGHRMLHPGFTR